MDLSLKMQNVGTKMRSANGIRKLFAAAGNFFVRRPLSRFSCGDCERNAQCGLPPHDDCVFRLMQIARDGDRLPQRFDYLYPAVWPRAGTRHDAQFP
jgi:hypothetical protein